MRASTAVCDDIAELLRLVQTGKLFAVQDWIRAGKPLRGHEANDASSVLCAAARTGFHSLVEELVRAGGWSPSELADALEAARDSKNFEIASLLEQHGARPKPLDFQACCEKLDLFMMERHLREGTDPNRDNVFAQVLSSVKARPLLRFYRQFRGEFPALDDQAALALAVAVRARQARWTALLAWAGADPFRPVPGDISEPFPVDPGDCTTAAKLAVWHNNPEILKALKLKPTPAQAVELLAETGDGNPKLFQDLLAAVPREQINHTPRGSSAALERLVGRWAPRHIFRDTRPGEGDEEALRCVELLLDFGARWNPPPEDLRGDRRALLGHEPRYLVQLLRLLLYSPNAANLDGFFELCRSHKLEEKLKSVDAPFLEELHDLRKAHRKITCGGASTSKETAAAAS